MLKKIVNEIYKIWITERPNLQAAALAFFGMFSFAPVIFIAFSMVGIFADAVQIGDQFYQRLQNLFGEEIALLIQESIAALSKPSAETSILISIISFLALFYAASGVFFQLQYALNIIWHVPPPEKGQTGSFIRQRLFSFVTVIGVGLMGIVAVFTNLLLSWFGSVLENLFGISPNQSIMIGVFALLLLVLTFALFYKLLPETKIGWGDVWLGAGIAALLVLILITLAGWFFQNTSLSSALQVAGGFSVLLLGFYYIAQIFLLGAIICRVYAEQLGSRRSAVEPGQ
jgi:membrane protein